MEDAGKAKKLLFVLPVLLGIVVVVFMVRSRGGPEQTPPGELASKVRAITVPEVTLVPRALGYGNVRPGMVWEAVAQVGGQIVEIHPQLKKGAILGKGEVLLRIDPGTYHLAIAQTEATIRSVGAQLAELRIKEQNTGASLKIEERILELSNRDLSRKRALLKNRTVSQASVDEQERNVLTGRQSVQTLRNTLNIIPAERQTLMAQLALHRAHWNPPAWTFGGPRSPRLSIAASPRSTWRGPSTPPRARSWSSPTASTSPRSPPSFRWASSSTWSPPTPNYRPGPHR